MEILLSTHNIDDYRLFLKIKSLPNYRFRGSTAIIPDEYAALVAGQTAAVNDLPDYIPSDFLFDYQRDISAMAIRKQKMAIFADCGLGKTLIYGEFAKYVDAVLPKDKCILIVSPLMVVDQTIDEYKKWYGNKLLFEYIPSSELESFTKSGNRFGITNFEALKDTVEQGRIGALIIDESSMLKSHYGKWGREILRLGRGIKWKLAGTGTPAPNDRIEYANHAVFLDIEPNVNSFLARYFVNKSQMVEKWTLKPHAIGPFYKSLSHWSIFLANPATYGWRDHSSDIPPIHVHIHHVPMTNDQHSAIQSDTGQLLVTHVGGVGSRSRLGQIAKGHYRGRSIDTNKPRYIRELVESWPDEKTIIWCLYNAEQEQINELFNPDCVANISGDTPYEKRKQLINEFKSGHRKIMITKPKILGFGLNLQCATRQIFSGLQDSYESYYQAVKRSNRVGSRLPLNVHIPVTDAELPMIDTVLKKAKRVQEDTEEQERIFKSHAITRYRV